jgi:uncharacterized protein (DUF1330 family)
MQAPPASSGVSVSRQEIAAQNFGVDTIMWQQIRNAMTVYAIAQLKMIDRAAYDRYQARFFEVFKKFSGRLLSADESPAVVEGAWDRDKVVLMSFPDEAAFRAWADSPDYREIAKDRKAGAQATVLLVKGFAPGA